MLGAPLQRMPQKYAEEAALAADGITTFDTESGGAEEEDADPSAGFSLKSLLWHGGSAWDAWFSCASNQVPKFGCF